MNRFNSSLNRSCQERVLQAKKTLEQQTNFLADLQQKKQNRTQSIQNILSSSIQKAKQKVAGLDQSRSHSNILPPTQPKKNPQSNGSAVANAMKSLQKKCADLQTLNEVNQKQKKLYIKQVQNLKNQKNIILSNLQETKRNLMNQQQTVRKLNAQAQQNKDKIKKLNDQMNKLKLQIKSKDKKIEQIEKQNKQKLMKLSYEQPQKKKQNQMMYETKMQQLKIIEEQLQKKQSYRGQQFKKNMQSLRLANQVKLKLQIKINQLQSKNNIQLFQIQKLQSQLEYVKSMNQTRSISSHNQNIIQLQQTKIDQLEQQIRSLKTTKKKKDFSKNNEVIVLTQQLQEIKEKYQETFLRMKNAQTKLNKVQRQDKNYRSKFLDLKDVFDQIVQKINKMPKSITSDLRLLIVRGNKIDTKNTSTSRKSMLHDNFTPSKHNRSSSFENTYLSKSKSKSKRKPLKMTDLQSSRNSMQSNRSAKSKKNTSIDKSATKKINHNTTTNKSIIVSTKKMQKQVDTNTIIDPNVQLAATLQKQLKALKKQYKKLVQSIQDQLQKPVEVSQRLNQIATQIQTKSQQLFDVKKVIGKKI